MTLITIRALQRWTAGATGLMLCSFFGCSDRAPGQTGPDPVGTTTPTPTVTAADTSAPPPVSGGTLLITRDDSTAVAADPDRDSIWLVDLAKRTVRVRVRLGAKTEPGRVIEDRDGKVHVALRRGGQVVRIDPQSGAVLSTASPCPAPRGLAYDGSTDSVHVACAGGELVTLRAQDSTTVRSTRLDPDLRDVVMKGDHLLVSRFRSADLLELDASLALVGRVKPRTTSSGMIDLSGRPVTASPTTAWRLTSLPTGEALMLHQRGLDSLVSTRSGGYTAGSCKASGAVSSGMTVFGGTSGPGGAVSAGSGGTVMMISMAVDVAVSRDGQQLAMISTGASAMGTGIALIRRQDLSSNEPCLFPALMSPVDADAEPIAGAYDGQGKLWVQQRHPAKLVASAGDSIPFSGTEDRRNEGHRLFHKPTAGMMACASCHAEAGDDGHVWKFDPIGPRRTQHLRGGILSSAPFHWDGDMADLTALMGAVFTGRMGGQPLSPEQVYSVGTWLDAQAVHPRSAARDTEAVERGRALFNDSTVGCAGCHSGPRLSNDQLVDVGTGKRFKVPTLLELAGRAPYMHTGCAATLRDRFKPECGGGDRHGQTSQLSTAQIDDLVAYLETL
jgi:mono/diheme cytochrome c family protein